MPSDAADPPDELGDGERYDDAFYDDIAGYAIPAAAAVVPVVADLVQPGSVVDVGCGDGVWLSAWQAAGVSNVLGIDGDHVRRERLRIDRDRFLAADLASPPTIDRRFDLACSLEVAEHLPPHAAGGFVRWLTQLAPVVLFSAAVPGQGGVRHVNEQWPPYWCQLFAAHGFVVRDIIRPRVWLDARVAHFYRQNLLLFSADGRFDDVEPAFPLTDAGGVDVAMPLVHPDLFTALHDHQRSGTAPAAQGLTALLRQLPSATARAAARRVPRQDG